MPSFAASRCSLGNKAYVICRTDFGAFNPLHAQKTSSDTVSNRLLPVKRE